MSRLIAFGSSPISYTHGGNQTFPAIVAQKLGKDYVEISRRWISNNKITRKILSYPFESTDTVLVCWTNSLRVEFRTEQGWVGLNRDTAAVGSFEETWYQGPGRWEYTSILNTVKEMLLAQTFLKSQGLSYLFVSDNNDYFHSFLVANPDEYLSSLLGLLDHDNILSFEGNQGFLPWAKSQGYQFNGGQEQRGYPEHQAHAAAAEYILAQGPLK
jgi:hypothetical protein